MTGETAVGHGVRAPWRGMAGVASARQFIMGVDATSLVSCLAIERAGAEYPFSRHDGSDDYD
jgi:hypothetical protein